MLKNNDRKLREIAAITYIRNQLKWRMSSSYKKEHYEGKQVLGGIDLGEVKDKEDVKKRGLSRMDFLQRVDEVSGLEIIGEKEKWPKETLKKQEYKQGKRYEPIKKRDKAKKKEFKGNIMLGLIVANQQFIPLVVSRRIISQDEADILYLRSQGKRFEDISRELNISVDAVKKRSSRGLRKTKEAIYAQIESIRNVKDELEEEAYSTLEVCDRLEKEGCPESLTDEVYKKRLESQFDFIQCVHAVAENGNLSDGYPSFGRFYNSRVEPIISKLIESRKARSLVPGVTDEKLAGIILDLDDLAGREFFSYAGWDRGMWSDQQVVGFLEKNRPENQKES